LRRGTVYEVGPTTGFATAPDYVCHNKARYAVIDRFPGIYDSPEAKHWYRQIEENWPRFYPQIPWSGGLRAAEFPESCNGQVDIIAKPIEEAKTDKSFDIICSFQVGEHVEEPDPDVDRPMARVRGREPAVGECCAHAFDDPRFIVPL
jgi:hypothetical protein